MSGNAPADEFRPYDPFFVPDKEDGFVYKWCNTRERVMLMRSHQGYEVVTKPEDVPEAVRLTRPPMPEQTGVTTRVRGDLILMRIRKDLHERNVAGPIRRNAERQQIALDTAIDQASEAAQKALNSQYGGRVTRDRMVFRDTPDPYKR